MVFHQTGEEIGGAGVFEFVLALVDGLAEVYDDGFVVSEELFQHFFAFGVFAGGFLEVGEIEEFLHRSDGFSAELVDAFGDFIDGLFQLGILFFEQQVEFHKAFSGDVPVKFSRLCIEHDCIGEDSGEKGRNAFECLVGYSNMGLHKKMF